MPDETPLEIRAFVQARMGSSRFPGKVLAPFRGEPIVRHVLRAVATAVPPGAVVLVTSADPSDDPLACYVAQLGFSVWRGPLDDVFERFCEAARAFPSEWILRVSADSPLLDASILQRVIDARGPYDLVTTIFPRTFARGQNAELIRTASLLAVEGGRLSADDREHVTPVFYRHADRYKIQNVESAPHDRTQVEGYAVDTLDDLRRLEAST